MLDGLRQGLAGDVRLCGRRSMVGWIGAALAAVVLAWPAEAQRDRSDAVPRFDDYVAPTVRLSSSERRRLMAGEAVTRLLPGDASIEVGVFGAIWIDAPRSRYSAAVQDIERFERGGAFKVTRRISDPPRLDDFAALRLSDEDLEDLRDCRVGDCAIKLGAEPLARFQREIDWTAPNAAQAATALMQRVAFEQVGRYLEGGNAQLAVYSDGERPTFTAHEFRAMVDGMPVLTDHMPDIRRYLLEYPDYTMPDATSFLYWQETDFGLKPTIRISHLTIRERPEETVVTSKMIYASHYFRAGLELRVLVPDPSRGAGFWLITVNRSRTDGLSGFTGFFVRRRVRSDVETRTRVVLRSTKQKMEGSAP